MIRRVLVAALAALVLATPALGSEQQPTLAELENEVICPTCHTTLALSHSQIADRMRQYIRQQIAAGDTKGEIKDALVAEFGEGVLAEPPAEGFNLLAWVLPFVGLAAAALVVGALAYRWTRSSRTGRAAGAGDGVALNGSSRLDPDLERRVDEELARFDA